MKLRGTAPKVITFDCYGTLIQWDEGLVAAIESLLRRHDRSDLAAGEFMAAYGDIEHRIEQTPPYRRFREIAALAFPEALARFDIRCQAEDIAAVVEAIPTFGPFPEVPGVLERLRKLARLAIISNIDDDLIAGNVERIGVPLDAVITAEQAKAYKPSRAIFEHAYRQLGVDPADTVHVCASPILDLTACRELGLRCVWINRIPGQRAPAGFEPDAVLPDLSGVPDLLGA